MPPDPDLEPEAPVLGGPVVDGGVVLVRPGRWSVPVPGTRLRLGVGLVAVLLVAAVSEAWAVVVDAGDEYAGDPSGAGPGAGAAVAVAAAVVASVVLHEGAHAFAARALGYRVDWVVVGLVDGKTSYFGRSDRPLERAAIAMAGPAASAAAVLALLAVWATGRVGPGDVVLPGLWFNVAMFGLNLVPVAGSDGWCVVAGLLEDRRRRRCPNRSRLGAAPPAEWGA